MSEKFRAVLKETQTQFVQSYDDTILKVIGFRSIFTAEEELPIMVVGSLSTINKTRETAELSTRNLFASIDTKDMSLSQKFFSLAFTETYFYRDFSEREDQEIQQLPPQMQEKVIEYLIKFECSALQHPLTQKLVYHCIFSQNANRLEKIGLLFISKFRYS